MKTRQSLAVLLALLFVLGLLAGCGISPPPLPAVSSEASELAQNDPTAGESAAAADTVPAEPDPELPSIPWSKAFRTSKVPEGVVAADRVAFLRNKGDEGLEVVNVPLAEIYAGQPEHLPRTRYFEQFMPEALVEGLLPVLDYAMAQGFSRFCIPTSQFHYGTMQEAASFLAQTFNINGNGAPGGLEIQSFPQDDGKTLIFLLVTLGGMEERGLSESYLQGVDEAKRIVDAMPEGLDEEGKMLYLYQYLTDNVRYDYDDYYTEQNWCLLYDALVRKKTVCAGFTEALYVMANLAGIECFTLRGYINLGASPGNHIWNIARINGEYYQFDSTWDEGESPADYRYFGVSDAWMLEHHTEYVTEFAKQYCPPCPENLLPPAFSPEDEQSPAYEIYWYYRLRNARAYDPERFLHYLGYEDDEIDAQGEVDGWVQTSVDLSEVFDILLGLMTTDQAARFLPGYFLSGKDNALMYHVPQKNQALTRLTSLEENEDGSWTAQVCEFRNGVFTQRKDIIALEKMDDDWFVVADVTPEAQ